MPMIELTQDNIETVIEGHDLVLIDFWAGWCAPCKAFALVYDEVAMSYPGVVFAKCDIEANAELASEFAIRSVPHLMILREHVAVYDESGLLDKPALVDLIEQTKALDMVALKQQLQQQSEQE